MRGLLSGKSTVRLLAGAWREIYCYPAGLVVLGRSHGSAVKAWRPPGGRCCPSDAAQGREASALSPDLRPAFRRTGDYPSLRSRRPNHRRPAMWILHPKLPPAMAAKIRGHLARLGPSAWRLERIDRGYARHSQQVPLHMEFDISV